MKHEIKILPPSLGLQWILVCMTLFGVSLPMQGQVNGLYENAGECFLVADDTLTIFTQGEDGCQTYRTTCTLKEEQDGFYAIASIEHPRNLAYKQMEVEYRHVQDMEEGHYRMEFCLPSNNREVVVRITAMLPEPLKVTIPRDFGAIDFVPFPSDICFMFDIGIGDVTSCEDNGEYHGLPYLSCRK